MAGESGKWPIPTFPKSRKDPNKSGTAGKGGAAANKHSTVGSMNTGKAAELKAKQ